MSIRFVGYPTIATRPKKPLSSLSWSEISDISRSGDAPYVFTLGDSKDGAILVYQDSSTMVFSLGNVGSACIQRESTYRYDHLSASYLSVKDSGWYTSTVFAGNNGVTLDSVWSSLSQDLKSVIKNVTKSYKRALDATQYTISGTFTLYPPTYSEWISYKDYLPKTGIFWLRDARAFIKDEQGATKYYKEGSWFETYNLGDGYHGDAGYGWVGETSYTKEGITNENLVLLFEV